MVIINGSLWPQVSGALRFLVYEPLLEGRLVRKPNAARQHELSRRAGAVLACFFVSGVMHEYCFW